MQGHAHRSRHAAVILLASVAVLSLCTAIVSAAPVLGFREDFATGVDSWQGGSGPFNPGSGGYSGGTDGYLRLENAFAGHFGAFSNGPEFVGNWTTAGITQIRVWMNDVDNQDNFQIHLAIGRFRILVQSLHAVVGLGGPTVVALRGSTRFVMLRAVVSLGRRARFGIPAHRPIGTAMPNLCPSRGRSVRSRVQGQAAGAWRPPPASAAPPGRPANS